MSHAHAFYAPDVQSHRQTKREAILDFFRLNIGVRFSSAELHAKYGSSFRTRVSELNRDASCPVLICNQVNFLDGVEQSVYWAESKRAGETLPLFPESRRA